VQQAYAGALQETEQLPVLFVVEQELAPGPPLAQEAPLAPQGSGNWKPSNSQSVQSD
jgi:hypothetical protein